MTRIQQALALVFVLFVVAGAVVLFKMAYESRGSAVGPGPRKQPASAPTATRKGPKEVREPGRDRLAVSESARRANDLRTPDKLTAQGRETQDAKEGAQATEEVGPLFPAEQGGKWGYIDKNLRFVIEPRFDGTFPFSEGLARVLDDDSTGSYGFIDKKGNWVIKPRLSYPGDFSCGRAVVRVGNWQTPGKYGYIDKTGKMIIPARYVVADRFRQGFAVVAVGPERGRACREGYECQVIDLQGKPLVQSCRGATGFFEGLCAVCDGQRSYHMDLTGEEVFLGNFKYAGRFSTGLATVSLDGVKWGYIDREGTMVIKPQYDGAYPFSEGLALVKRGEEWLFIDRNGKPAIFLNKIFPGFRWPWLKYVAAYPGNLTHDEREGLFSDRMLRIYYKEKWGYIDKTGKIVVEPQYWSACDFSHGWARVGTLDTTSRLLYRWYPPTVWSYIDKQGRYVWNPPK